MINRDHCCTPPTDSPGGETGGGSSLLLVGAFSVLGSTFFPPAIFLSAGFSPCRFYDYNFSLEAVRGNPRGETGMGGALSFGGGAE
jgi:hypothetical protein